MLALLLDPFTATIVGVQDQGFMPLRFILTGLSLFILIRMRLRDAVPQEAQGPFVAFLKTLLVLQLA